MQVASAKPNNVCLLDEEKLILVQEHKSACTIYSTKIMITIW